MAKFNPGEWYDVRQAPIDSEHLIHQGFPPEVEHPVVIGRYCNDRHRWINRDTGVVINMPLLFSPIPTIRGDNAK